MNDSNPYSTPSSQFSQAQEDTYQPTVFTFSGRIGRLRYIAYSIPWSLVLMAGMMIFGIIAAVLIPIMGGSAGAIGVMIFLWVLIGLASFLPMFSLAIRRLNDMNTSGWVSLVMLIPFVNFLMVLVLLFFPGTQGKNNYGPEPNENSTLVILGALIFLPLGLIAGLGIVAAVALPAYQDYTLRAETSAANFESVEVRSKVEMYYLENDELPAQNQDIDHHWRSDSPNIESIDVSTGGVVTIALASTNNNINGKTIIYRPSVDQGYIEWDCRGGDLEAKYRTVDCR